MRNIAMQRAIDQSKEMLTSREPNAYFYYDDYFHKWDRILARGGNEYKYTIAVSLEAINRDIQSEWDSLKYVKLRLHTTPTNPYNYINKVPIEIYDNLTKNCNNELANLLIHEDIMKFVDLDLLYEKSTGGGVPLKTVALSSPSYLPLDLRLKSNPKYWELDDTRRMIIENVERNNLSKGYGKTNRGNSY